MEIQRTHNSQHDLEKEQVRKLILLDFKTYSTTVKQDSVILAGIDI